MKWMVMNLKINNFTEKEKSQASKRGMALCGTHKE